MNINSLEYVAPTQANKIGSIKFEVEIPILYEEGKTKQVSDAENVEVNLSVETQNFLERAGESIINDITK